MNHSENNKKIFLKYHLLKLGSASKALNQYKKNFNDTDTDSSFTVADSNSIIFPIAQEKQIFKDISGIWFLFYHKHVCCVCSLESPHRGDSNEYTQHTIFS